jgi:hypothetical protein
MLLVGRSSHRSTLPTTLGPGPLPLPPKRRVDLIDECGVGEDPGSLIGAGAEVAAISQGLDFGFQCSLIPASAPSAFLSGGGTLSILNYRYRMYPNAVRIHLICNMYLKAFCT